MTNVEIWKDIPKFEDYYQASSQGKIRSTKSGRILKQRIMRGYLRICLSKNNIKTHHFSHRLIAYTFIENPLKKPFINHKNGIRNDNRIENLEWCTNSENQKHSYRELNRIHHKPHLGKTGILCKNSKKVNQYDLHGKLIKTWDSIADIVRANNISQSAISKACMNNTVSFNYKWKFA